MTQSKPHLLIVSDSPMCNDGQGMRIIESTLREVENLTELFDKIIWIGFERKDMLLGGSRYDQTGKIESIALPLYGGSGLINKIKQLWALPSYWIIIWKYLKTAQYIHTRAPSVPALMILLFNLFDKQRHYWHKFAGNWVRTDAPKSYQFQKWLMIRLKNTYVTVNGKWEGYPKHILPFENPCITDEELQTALIAAQNKIFNGQLNILFVGRIEKAKGVDKLVEALAKLTEEEWNQIGFVKFVGLGRDFVTLKKYVQDKKLAIEFCGSLNRTALDALYAQAHIFFLPSEGEGFPKVVSEAASYGCVPVVTDVSSITQYIHDQVNGLVLENNNPENIYTKFNWLLTHRSEVQQMSNSAAQLGKLFTYKRYNQRILHEIFQLNS